MWWCSSEASVFEVIFCKPSCRYTLLLRKLGRGGGGGGGKTQGVGEEITGGEREKREGEGEGETAIPYFPRSNAALD